MEGISLIRALSSMYAVFLLEITTATWASTFSEFMPSIKKL